MLKKITHKFKVLVLLVATLFVSNSCSDLLNNPLQDKETGENIPLLLLDLNVFDTKVTIHIMDEATGQYITEDQVVVSFDGDDADKIVDPSGKKKEEYTVKNGILEIAIDPSFTPSESDPIEFHVNAGTAEPKWYSFGEDISITEAGTYDIVVDMIAEGTNDGESEDIDGGDGEIELIPFLKSTSATLENPPFTLAVSGLGKFTKTSYAKPVTSGGVTYYFYLKPQSSTAVVTSATFTAKNFTGDAKIFSDWGFNGNYYVGTKRTTLPSKPLLKSGTYKNFKNYRFEAGAVIDNEKCAKGLTISIKESTGKKGSAEFDYVVKTKKGVIIKKSKITANFTAANKYTVSTTISPIYYPKADAAVIVELSTTGTYTIDKQSIEFSSPCDQKAEFSVTPKVGLKAYSLTTSLSCQSGGVGAAPTMRGTVTGPGLTGEVPFTFSQGTATLNLLPNENYTIAGTYNNKSASFGLTTKTDAASIKKVIDDTKASFHELYNLTLSVSDNSISIGVVFTEKDCPF